MPVNIFYIHTSHQMIKTERRDENGERWSACSVQFTAQWHDVCVMQKSKSASQKHWMLFVDICLQSPNCNASKRLQSVFGLTTDLPNVFTKLHEALWRHRKVMFKTSLRETFSQGLCELACVCLCFFVCVFVFVYLLTCSQKKKGGGRHISWPCFFPPLLLGQYV